jgi:hypothetical protein
LSVNILSINMRITFALGFILTGLGAAGPVSVEQVEARQASCHPALLPCPAGQTCTPFQGDFVIEYRCV